MRLKDRTAIVTGAARGIGLAAARRFAAEGAKVVLVDLNVAQGEAAASALRAQGHAAHFIACDVSDARQVAETVDGCERQFGVPDILLNNAAIYRSHDFLAMTEDDFGEVIRCNLNSVFLVSQAVARKLVAAGRPGAIVNISSINARMTSAGAVAYSASKGGVSALTAAAALALADHGIRVNAIAPGTIATELAISATAQPDVLEKTLSRIPAGRLGEPDEIASVACFLASDDASYMTGQTIFVDGGRTALSIVTQRPRTA